LTSVQLASYPQQSPAKTPDGNLEPSCSWYIGPADFSKNAGISISFYPKQADGLSTDYQKAGSWWKFFQPTKVSGYPAAYVGLADKRSTGDCAVNIGLNDNQIVQVYVQLWYLDPSPCDVASKLSVDVVGNIKKLGA
jgi:hypothetical protein